MNYNKIFVFCSVFIVLLLIIGIYFFGNTLEINHHEIKEEIQIAPTEIN